ncbi:MAG: hypothetical protein LBG73_09970 [Spirochaetaceae bacterium]|jgi:hypothetical protein|nr:hypothetical protein [Spirochaetaceae bacterium]
MKLKHGLMFGFAAIFLAAIFSFTACGGDKDDDDPPPPAQKSLTLTGFSGIYEGMYVMASMGDTADPALSIIGAASYSSSGATLVQISGGQVVLPLWSVNQSTASVSAYNGSNTVSGMCVIYATSSVSMDGSVDSVRYGSFSNANLGAPSPTVAVTIQ